ncbi:MAG TPA: hypothetical protein V6C65_09105, partial [Allocoleopsis sp.]
MQRWILVIVTCLVSPLAFGTGLSDIGIRGGVGLMGWNLGATYRVNDFVSVGAGLNRFSYSYNGGLKGVNYNADLKLSSEMLFVNIYPFAGGFHLTGGWVHNGNALTLSGQPDQNGNYTFNGQTYSGSQVGTVNAGLGFGSSATYLGIGWGGNGDWGMTLDIGAMNQGTPKFSLNASAAASNPQLQNDVNQQQAQTQ